MEANDGVGSGPEDNKLLHSLSWQETFAEIVDLLTGAELLVAYLRAQGLDDKEIGAWLGCDPADVTRSMVQARRRIQREAPHLAEALGGRK